MTTTDIVSFLVLNYLEGTWVCQKFHCPKKQNLRDFSTESSEGHLSLVQKSVQELFRTKGFYGIGRISLGNQRIFVDPKMYETVGCE